MMRSQNTTLVRLAAACAAAAALGAVSAAPAAADYSLPPCGGGAIQGSGSTVQTNAQSIWGPNFELACVSDATVTYSSTGSGIGRTRFSNRQFDLAAFAGTDEAPGDALFDIEAGPSGTDDGVLETIPVTATAIAVIVNLPDGCGVDIPVSPTDPRPAISKGEVEDIYAGEIENWVQLSALAGGDADCNTSINRVVRSDNSGTTFHFKRFLETVDDVEDDGTNIGWWGPNQSWPDTTVNPGPAQPGGQPLANKVATEDASIGYVALGDARDAGFQRATTGTDDEYWLPLRSGAPDSTTDPFVDPSEAGVTGSTKGANCDASEYRQSDADPVPTTTQSQPEWRNVVGLNSASGYSICAPTYVLAWRDAADVDEDPAPPQLITEDRQRTVRDYLEYILSDDGQADALSDDYAALPPDLLTTARTGVDRVCWSMLDDTTPCE
jgi:ABC-type phosphate transport system substrate-binding protein